MRPLLGYIALVGVPVLALLGILRLGEGLVAPRAVHGQYEVTVDSLGVDSCLAQFAGAEKRMTIVQSGTRLLLTVGQEMPVTFTGTIAGYTIRAAAATACLTADSIALSATVERTAAEPRIVGAFEVPGCATCRAAPFQARRLSPDGR